MINNPSAIDEIADTGQIRVLFYASHKLVHAPLNKVLDKVKDDIQHDLLNVFTAYQKETEQRIETLQEAVDELRLQLVNLTHPEDTN
ncbi:hypothetical protein [Bartonella sp. WD12.1]|uniref:hypothetical protein n=1 Tax=Bartonella sp. WD12.1 TaxID=1933903 RepID=UPI00099AF242|nr:hypothetical protein [Bartonella sp. WD12.1]OPB29492.1 hypothetical protein BWD121_005120 [Bartonella sp. WD12.1]OPB29646.1 hypothetical protein BWD121_006680 [Bartonella sp. WD12.1]